MAWDLEYGMIWSSTTCSRTKAEKQGSTRAGDPVGRKTGRTRCTDTAFCPRSAGRYRRLGGSARGGQGGWRLVADLCIRVRSTVGDQPAAGSLSMRRSVKRRIKAPSGFEIARCQILATQRSIDQRAVEIAFGFLRSQRYAGRERGQGRFVLL